VKRQNINEWLQLGASVGVIMSLIFVGIEIQQSRQIAMADVYQQRAAMLIDVQLGTLPWNEIQAAMSKSFKNEALTVREEFVIGMWILPWFSYWENNCDQFQHGWLAEEQWRASRNAMFTQFVLTPQFREFWQRTRGEHRESFVVAVDQVLAEAIASLD